MKIVDEYFGCDVFSTSAMQRYLPHAIYKQMMDVMEKGKELPKEIADVVANAMKDWAMDKGATHYTHWFQPMTGITAEKHDAFINPTGPTSVISDFRGKELIKGEPDASSFPSGGLRATFEARGYTAWDPTSLAFVKEKTLYIPTLFCSYDGSALDKKTPLLRSNDALNKAAVRLLNIMGYNIHKIKTTVGPEQEYFLIDEEMFKERLDLLVTGRTLFGAAPVKGQELDDHYFGSLSERVKAYMEEVDEELWKLGVLAKTKHNEVAPAQHELAPIFATTNIATDHNQLTMELMKSIANKHGLACLLHEKPFAGVNGSGKHNNWSISTDTGVNLLEPGDTPSENAQFLLFLTSIIKAVDDYQDLLRVSVASAGNDHRLGANEAPPAIVSIFLGDELTEILKSIENDTSYICKEKSPMEIGVRVLPKFFKDTTDRNRTSPFAFTGNKFEFRMLGSAFSIAGANIVLNTIVAEELSQFADILENSSNFDEDLNTLIKNTIKSHNKIIFNGNNYSNDWVKEAEKRGLLNLKTTPDALPSFVNSKNVELFTKHHVLSETELYSRYEILLDNYSKTIHIEALTMIDLAKKEIIPAILGYQGEIAEIANNKKKLSSSIQCCLEENILNKISTLGNSLYSKLEDLEKSVLDAKLHTEALDLAKYYRESVFMNMQQLRAVVDELETLVSKKYWTLPSYGELLFSVN